MKHYLFFILITLSNFSQAICYEQDISYAPPINIDLSDKLSLRSPIWITTVSTQFIGYFDCKSDNNEFSYTKNLNFYDQEYTIVSFMNGKYNVRVEIINEIPNIILVDSGEHSASELNTHVTIKFSLDTRQGMYVEGNSAYLDNILFVNDLNGVSYYNISGNMYAQPLMLTYRPQKTTCTFKNSGLTVTLPTLSLYQVINEEYAGYTPFVLNIKCNYQNNEIDITEQMIDIFLSSNNLLDSDNTVLIDNTENSAQGIGLRLVKTNNSENPLMISTTSNIRYEASSLLDHNEDSQLESYFSIPLAAYYYVWDQRSVSQGPINTNAVLNIIYP